MMKQNQQIIEEYNQFIKESELENDELKSEPYRILIKILAGDKQYAAWYAIPESYKTKEGIAQCGYDVIDTAIITLDNEGFLTSLG